jgi:hypothetical protein
MIVISRYHQYATLRPFEPLLNREELALGAVVRQVACNDNQIHLAIAFGFLQSQAHV